MGTMTAVGKGPPNQTQMFQIICTIACVINLHIPSHCDNAYQAHFGNGTKLTVLGKKHF